ncbi:MAG: phosphoenolpyruvate synthase [Candidatus Obscuribacterales bacterium]|nr:phosphoenolpyruvate synthase [Candidatus Obscuribacterales bacterium]
MTDYIRFFNQINLSDVALVGGKNASLGELTQAMERNGINVPPGFAITSEAYDALLNEGKIKERLYKVLENVDKNNIDSLRTRAQEARDLIKNAGLPPQVAEQIKSAYKQLIDGWEGRCDVAVRSSATAEDLPNASFAGQQESFVNVCGEAQLLDSCLNCFASLFTDRAIVYRIDNGFDHLSVKLSIGVQQMVRSDLASSGVIFTLDPESGFRNVVLVTSAYGLGESVVGGLVDPDEFLVYKPTLDYAFCPIIRTKCGAKQTSIIYDKNSRGTTKTISVPEEQSIRYSLNNTEVVQLARWACAIEKHYSQRYGHDTPMDIEWAKDGQSQELFIVQARPETVQSRKSKDNLISYTLKGTSEVLLKGRSIGEQIGTGTARVISSLEDLSQFEDGDVLVAEMTDPDWEPVMKRAGAIVTSRGGRTCHAAIVSRELGVPCIVGTTNATEALTTGQSVTVCCAEGAVGKVYAGILKYSRDEIVVSGLPLTRTKIMVNSANPEHAFKLSQLPVAGVGLAREEFIIANEVKVHPLALTRFNELKDTDAIKEIERLTRGYASKESYFVHKLAQGIGTIAAAFYPRDVIVRLSDFKTNEYANLIGGRQFEPTEDNPMIGFRGASRYYSELYRDGFALECQALQMVRKEMGLTNLKVMIPFCRTVDEAKHVIAEMESHGLVQHEEGLELYVMCELPSNVLLIDRFAQIFDGFSIGSNDLTQLILGVDRDSEILSDLFDERNEAVLRAIKQAIDGAHLYKRKIGICGQAPSDYPEFTKFLIDCGIDSISLSEDAVIKTLLMVADSENRQSLAHA